MGFASRGIQAAQVLTEVDTGIAKVLTNTTNKVTDARALNLDNLDTAISTIPTSLNYPVFHWQAIKNQFGALAGTWAQNIGASHGSGATVYNDATRTVDDAVGLGSFFIPETATYTLYLVHQTDSTYGKAHFMLNGVDEGEIDCYGATANNVLSSVTLGSLTAGQYYISLKTPDKHASATAYKISIQSVMIVKA
jgi:hypothetical protein